MSWSIDRFLSTRSRKNSPLRCNCSLITSRPQAKFQGATPREPHRSVCSFEKRYEGVFLFSQSTKIISASQTSSISLQGLLGEAAYDRGYLKCHDVFHKCITIRTFHHRLCPSASVFAWAGWRLLLHFLSADHLLPLVQQETCRTLKRQSQKQFSENSKIENTLSQKSGEAVEGQQ